jgi:hypothetical protein
VDDERYHLTLATREQPVMHGWWSDRATADRKHAAWKREHGSVDGARVTLVDEETGETLTTWSEEP